MDGRTDLSVVAATLGSFEVSSVSETKAASIVLVSAGAVRLISWPLGAFGGLLQAAVRRLRSGSGSTRSCGRSVAGCRSMVLPVK